MKMLLWTGTASIRMTLQVLLTLTLCVVAIETRSDLSIDDVTALVGQRFDYQIGDKQFLSSYNIYRIVERGTKQLPAWLTYDTNSSTLVGTPMRGDAGVYAIRMRALCINPTTSNCKDKLSRTFHIRVVEPPLKATSSRGSRPPPVHARNHHEFLVHAGNDGSHTKHDGKYSLKSTNQIVMQHDHVIIVTPSSSYLHELYKSLSSLSAVISTVDHSPIFSLHAKITNLPNKKFKHIKPPCGIDSISFYASLILHVLHDLSDIEKRKIMQRLSNFISKDVDLISLDDTETDVMSLTSGNKHILTAGPGNVIESLKRSIELSWHAACHNFEGIEDFSKVLQHNIDVGRITDELGYNVIAWYVYSDRPWSRRDKRDAHRARRQTGTPTMSPPAPTSLTELPLSSATEPTISLTQSSTFTVLSSVSLTQSSTFTMLSSVSLTQSSTFTMLSSVLLTQSSTFTVLSSVSLTQSSTFTVLSSISSTQSPTFTTLYSISSRQYVSPSLIESSLSRPSSFSHSATTSSFITPTKTITSLISPSFHSLSDSFETVLSTGIGLSLTNNFASLSLLKSSEILSSSEYLTSINEHETERPSFSEMSLYSSLSSTPEISETLVSGSLSSASLSTQASLTSTSILVTPTPSSVLPLSSTPFKTLSTMTSLFSSGTTLSVLQTSYLSFSQTSELASITSKLSPILNSTPFLHISSSSNTFVSDSVISETLGIDSSSFISSLTHALSRTTYNITPSLSDISSMSSVNISSSFLNPTSSPALSEFSAPFSMLSDTFSNIFKSSLASDVSSSIQKQISTIDVMPFSSISNITQDMTTSSSLESFVFTSSSSLNQMPKSSPYNPSFTTTILLTETSLVFSSFSSKFSLVPSFSSVANYSSFFSETVANTSMPLSSVPETGLSSMETSPVPELSTAFSSTVFVPPYHTESIVSSKMISTESFETDLISRKSYTSSSVIIYSSSLTFNEFNTTVLSSSVSLSKPFSLSTKISSILITSYVDTSSTVSQSMVQTSKSFTSVSLLTSYTLLTSSVAALTASSKLETLISSQFTSLFSRRVSSTSTLLSPSYVFPLSTSNTEAGSSSYFITKSLPLTEISLSSSRTASLSSSAVDSRTSSPGASIIMSLPDASRTSLPSVSRTSSLDTSIFALSSPVDSRLSLPYTSRTSTSSTGASIISSSSDSRTSSLDTSRLSPSLPVASVASSLGVPRTTFISRTDSMSTEVITSSMNTSEVPSYSVSLDSSFSVLSKSSTGLSLDTLSTRLRLMSSSILTTTAVPDTEPVLQNSIDHLIVYVGRYFEFTIPENTFIDAEDGNTRNLTLSISLVYDKPLPQGAWLMFNSTSQTLYGIALKQDFQTSDLAIEQFMLTAADWQGHIAKDVISLSYKYEAAITHTISVKFNESFAMFQMERTILVDIAENLAAFYNDTSLKYLTFLKVTEGSLTVVWGNNSLFGEKCFQNKSLELYDKLADANGSLSEGFQKLFALYTPMSASFEFDGVCLLPVSTEAPPTKSPVSDADNDKMWIEIVLPALIVILIIVIVALLLLVCCRHRRPNKTITASDKPMFLEDRRPIIFPDELEMVDPSLKPNRPLILPSDYLADFPPAVPPHGRLAPPPNDGMEPPTYRAPVLEDDDFNEDLTSPPPPTYGITSSTSDPPPYRLPPPYFNPHRLA